MFKALVKFFSKKSPQKNGAKTKRLHIRWNNNSSIFFLANSHNKRFDIENISYGGFALLGEKPPKDSDYRLCYLKQSTPVSFQETYYNGETTGYCFIHDDSSLFNFLQPIIENIRKGHSAQVIKSEFCQEPYNNSDWVIIRSEGPIDIQINRKLSTVNYTTLLEGHYYNINLKDYQLQMYKGIDQQGLSSRMKEIKEIEPKILYQTLSQVQGIQEQIKQTELERFKERLIKHLTTLPASINTM